MNERFIMLELSPVDMMMAIVSLAKMIVSIKLHPELIVMIPDEFQPLVVEALQMAAKINQRTESGQEADLEQSVKAAMDLIAKVSGK
jgi:hypothetical protein